MTLELNLTAEDRADTRKVEIPVEVKSESGFQPRREYDIIVSDGSQAYYCQTEVDEALLFAKESGHTDPEKIIEVARRRLLSQNEGGEKDE